MRIKYRVWDGGKYISSIGYLTLGIETSGEDFFFCDTNNGESGYVNISKDSFTEICIDKTDKHGNVLYEGDLLRVKHLLGDNEGWYVDAIYRISVNIFDGVRLEFERLFDMSEEADPKCQYPPETTLSVAYRTLTTDYKTPDYNRLAVSDSYSSSRTTRWQLNHFSNDIERIGNANENPDLLRPKSHLHL